MVGVAMSSDTPRGVLGLMMTPRVAQGALRVALVVGTVLNVINNGEQIWVHHRLELWPIVLNYLVPFCVSGYSAARNEALRGRGK